LSPKVAIVILNWNGRNYLEQFLPSVMATNYSNAEVVLADNNSTDDSIEFVRHRYPGIVVISLSQNFGFARGYNEALKQVEAAYYVLLNSDVEVMQNWIVPIVDLMEGDKTIGACQPKILTYNDRNVFEYAGAAGGWLDRFGYPFARGRIFDYCEKDNGQYDAIEPIFWASGAAMFVRSELYHKLGGLDEYFFAHQEEIDFCWRLQLAGYKVMACPASVVYHVGGGTLPKGNERKVFLNFRNNLIMLVKNLPSNKVFWKVSFRILLDVVSAWKSLFAGEATYFIAIMQAHMGFVRWLIFARKRHYPFTKNRSLKGWYHKSVVWQHFIAGKTTFSEIVGDKD